MGGRFPSCQTHCQEKQQLLKEWVTNGENCSRIESALTVSREQRGELERGRELLTISEMQSRGFSEWLIMILVLVLFYFLYMCLPLFPKKKFTQSTLARKKIESIVKRGGVPDEDAPTDAASMRFWCTTGARYTDRESTSVKMTAHANVAATPDQLATMLADPANSGGMAGAMPAAAVANSGVNLGELVDVIRNGNTGSTGAAKAKAKPKAKGSAGKRAKLEEAKTPAEVREAIRPFQYIWYFLFLGFGLLKENF